MASNSFGSLFRFTTWGESHGPAIGVVIDGCPARIPLTEADIQPYLDKRRPGQSSLTTQRQEGDKVRILSGTFEGVTTGAPISLMIENADHRSQDYADVKDVFRPGHADYTYQEKYGVRDYRGGGRASARETACRVAAGAVARKVLGPSVTVRAAVIQIGNHIVDRALWDWGEVERNELFAPSAKAADFWRGFLETVRKEGSSVGAVVEVVASGVPAGWGDPVYEKLDAEIARALMSINAVKGVEIGLGFAAAGQTGETNGDPMRKGEDGRPVFLSNHAGGILGGISTGQDVVARFALKPASSILKPQRSVDRTGENVDVVTKGRHDPCVGLRAVPVGEAMMACVLTDAMLRQKALA